MASTTPNRGLPYPELGDAANIESAVKPLALALDSTGNVYKGSAAPVAGAPYLSGDMYFRTSTGVYYFYDGSAWNTINPPSSGVPSTSNPLLTENDSGVMHTDKDRTITSIHEFQRAPRHTAYEHNASATIDLANGKVQWFSGAASQTLTLPAGTKDDEVEIVNADTTDVVTVTRSGSDTINGQSSFTIPPGMTAKLNCIALGGVWVARFLPSVVPACKLTTTGGQSISTQADLDAAGTVLTLGTTEINVGGDHNDTANKITIKQAGIYQINAKVHWNLNASDYDGIRMATLMKNNSETSPYIRDEQKAISGHWTGPVNHLNAILSLAAGDVLHVDVKQNSGSSIGIASTLGAYLSAHYIGAAS